MNILPLVSAFLIIFAICSYSFVHNLRTIVEEKVHYSGSFRIQRKFSQSLARHTYTKHKGKNFHSKQTSATPVKEEEASYHSPRDWQRKKPQSKLNIRSLLQPQSNPRLEKIALFLLQDLYYFAPFYKPGLENEILHTLLETLKENENLSKLEMLASKVPEEHFSLFYKLVKGTQSYKLHTTEGYPALGDFITLDKTQETQPPVHFCHASRPLLDAIFGHTLAPLIINEEKHKWEPKHKHLPLTKQELQAFLVNRRLNPSDYEPLFSFSQQSSPPPLEIVYDQESKLQIKIPL